MGEEWVPTAMRGYLHINLIKITLILKSITSTWWALRPQGCRTSILSYKMSPELLLQAAFAGDIFPSSTSAGLGSQLSSCLVLRWFQENYHLPNVLPRNTITLGLGVQHKVWEITHFIPLQGRCWISWYRQSNLISTLFI